MSRYRVLPQVETSSYQRNGLHAETCVWVEKNCYVDLFIELIHALGLEPRAMLPFTLAMDFEGDQWTFFKPQHAEMRKLYGVDVQEMTVWRPMIDHAVEHLSAGRLISTEADAFWLPDTSGTDYRRQHVKTTIVLADLDLARQRLGYFHNAGYYELEGEDFKQTFRLDAEPDPTFMPFFAELVRVDHVIHRSAEELAELSRELVRTYLAYRPDSNPIKRFAERFGQELPLLHEQGLDHYHAWAFGTIRQLGAAFELAALNLKWLAEIDDANASPNLLAAAEHFDSISSGNKALILKVARAVNAKRTMDPNEVFGDMILAWDAGMSKLDAEFKR